MTHLSNSLSHLFILLENSARQYVDKEQNECYREVKAIGIQGKGV